MDSITMIILFTAIPTLVLLVAILLIGLWPYAKRILLSLKSLLS